jgi:O-antigen ligase
MAGETLIALFSVGLLAICMGLKFWQGYAPQKSKEKDCTNCKKRFGCSDWDKLECESKRHPVAAFFAWIVVAIWVGFVVANCQMLMK